MKRSTKTLGVLGLIGCTAINTPLAMAEDAGWYLGGNAGQSRAKIDDARITSSLLGAGSTVTSIQDDNRDTGYKIFAGYQLNENFAVEAGYFELGRFGYTATVTPPGTLTGQIRLNGVNIDAVGILPLSEQFSVFGRFGVNYAQARDNFVSTGLVLPPINPNPSKREANYKYSVGLQYNLNESLGLRAEVERYRINDAVGNRGDVDLISLGIVYYIGAEKPAPATAQVSEQVAEAKPAVKPVVTPPPPPPPARKKVTFSADSSTDALFSFGEADITPAGKRALDTFAAELKGAQFEEITVTGHTDRIGTHTYNQLLSERRADAVKDYLIESAGIPAEKITARGVDGSDPVTQEGDCPPQRTAKASQALIACLAPDRRVDVEVEATRTTP
ncbi:MAG: OmpA family protein [Gallionella sp.]|nr:OmpA family protein [Gallionella sp.]